MIQINNLWPDMHFGPINLWAVVPAYMIGSRQERLAKAWLALNPTEVGSPQIVTTRNSPTIARMVELTAAR